MRSDGETLAGIAQALWGDRSMWYLIADANGLTLSSALKAGQLLVIPNKVTNIHNNSSTWRPYNAGEAIGRTDPTVPVPPPPAKKGCGTLGTVIMAAVAVAVMATLGPVAVSALGSQVLGYAAAAAAASVASQGVGLAIGQIDSFSWKAVGQAAFGGAITGGIAAYANTAGSALQSLSGTGWVASAGKAALGSAATMALKGDWNWRNVMISAVSAGVGQAVGSVVGGEAWAQAGNGFGARLTSGLAGSLVARSLTGGNRASFETVFASTLGNAIGESLASQSGPDQGANNRTLLNAAERAADPDRYTSWKEQFPDLSQFYGQPWSGDNVAPAVDRSQDIQLAAAKGYDGIGLGKAMPGDEPGTVQFNTLRGPQYRKAINFDGTTQEYYVLDPVEVTGKSVGTLAREAAPVVRVLSEPISLAPITLQSPLSLGLAPDVSLPTTSMAIQELNDIRAIEGTLNTTSEAVAAAWNGDWAAARAHWNYEPSEAARAAVYSRVFPQGSPELARIDTMVSSPVGAILYGASRWAGASQSTQDALLTTGGIVEGVGGGLVGIRTPGRASQQGPLARVRSSNRPASPLLPNEGQVGTYDDLLNAGTKGDNITPHHIPSAKLMERYGVSKGDGIAMNMEMPSPGVGGRHRQTFTYGNSADVDMLPRDALAAGIRDARNIYQQDGLYDAYIRQRLQEMIRQNKTTYPEIFQKKKP